MHKSSAIFTTISSIWLFLFLCSTSVEALYGSSSPVLQLTPTNFKSKVLNSNGVVLVEFFAPWCGHCKALTPIWEKAAAVLKGVATVAALDADAHQSLAQEYGIQGFPTIKVFLPGKPPVDYQGARDAKSISNFAYQQIKSLLKDRLDGKATGKSSEKSSGNSEPSASVELNSLNFDELVLKSKDLWVVEFFAPWCGHCKKLAPEWKKASINLKGKVKLGHVDCEADKTLMSRFNVAGFPTILVFGADKDRPSKYEGARSASAIESFALEQLEVNLAPPEVTELTSQDIMEDKCGSAAICFVSFLPDILDSKADGRNKYLELLLSVAEKFKRSPYSYVWAAAGMQPELEKQVGVGGYGYPAMVALNVKKGAYAPLRSAFERDYSSGEPSRRRLWFDFKSPPNQLEKMDAMDIDQVVEVPDTPDRLASQNINGKNCIRRERYVSSMANLIENADTSAAGLQGVPRNNKRATKSESRSMFIPPRHDSTKNELQGNLININSENALASRGPFRSRRTAVDHTFNHRGKSNFHPEYMGKGKALSSPNSEMAGCQGHVKVLDLTDEDDHLRTYQKFVTGSSQSKEHRKEMADKSVSPLPIVEDSHVGKINDNPRTSHRTSCQKKLVRNGCISPLNVAKAKLTAQRQNNTFLHSHQNDSGASRDSMAEVKDACRVERYGCVSPSNVSKAKQLAQTQNNTFLHPYQDDYGSSREPTAEDKHSHRVKGKGLLTHSGLLMESEAKARPLPGRVLAGKVDGASHANKAACVRSEGSSGWISTREHTRRSNPSLSDEEPLLFHRTDDPCNVNKLPRTVVARRDNKEGNITRKHSVSSQNASAAPISQTVSQKHQGGRLNDHPDSSNTVIKRQRQGSSRSHQGESSSSATSNSEFLVLGSSGEPSNARSVRTQNSHAARSFKPIIDIDEFSPETRSNGPCNIDRSSVSASDIRDRQLEADEILARELQEQLYNESNVAADREIDEHVALALQQEISQHAFASRSQHVPHPRSSSISNSHRENMLRSSQNSSTQRVTQPRGPTTNRMARLRSRFPGQPRTISSRQRNVVFPPNMDVDMRMHILEALEAFNDMGMAGSLLQAQRDFNENDYEMLLALDENNHQHGGASAAQINALPESTVQTDNLEECSICLETPSIGDTIRHLPCLHKFHKDCIDEWVRRRTTCPICKSSVT